MQNNSPEPPMSRRFVPSENIAQLKESVTIAVSARARELKAAGIPVIDLGAGEPDFPTPEFIRRAATNAVEAGATKYTVTEGILPLRQAIARHANTVFGEDEIDARDIVVSNGTKQALFNACFVLFGSGDEVLVPTPGWTSYYEILPLARATPVPVMGDPSRGFKVTVDELEAAATDRTKGLILNSPNNPTGAVYSRPELRDLMNLAADRGWWVISDEIYQRIAYEERACSALEVTDDRSRLVVVNGVAKAYAMTGWRIGWAIAPRAVASAMSALQSHTTSNAAAMSQHAALAALTSVDEADAAVISMVAEFRRRRDAVVEVFRSEPDMTFLKPEGAFYMYVQIPAEEGEQDASAGFARKLLDQHRLAIVPGSAFLSPDWVRMSYASPLDAVVEGSHRLVAAWRERAAATAAHR